MAASLEAQAVTEILTENGLTREDVDKKCTPTLIQNIAIEIIEWELLGLDLGISIAKLTAIKRDFNSEERRRVALLQTWRQKEGRRATYLQLMIALHHRGRNDLVNSLCDMIKSCSSEVSHMEGNWQESTESGILHYPSHIA